MTGGGTQFGFGTSSSSSFSSSAKIYNYIEYVVARKAASLKIDYYVRRQRINWDTAWIRKHGLHVTSEGVSSMNNLRLSICCSFIATVSYTETRSRLFRKYSRTIKNVCRLIFFKRMTTNLHLFPLLCLYQLLLLLSHARKNTRLCHWKSLRLVCTRNFYWLFADSPHISYLINVYALFFTHSRQQKTTTTTNAYLIISFISYHKFTSSSSSSSKPPSR